MTIDRRQFLAGTMLGAVGLSGCLQGTDSAENSGDEPTSTVPEEPRIDEPPYEIEDQPNDRDRWDRLYLCKNMSGTSDRQFKMLSAPRADLLVSGHDPDEGNVYAVRALTSEQDVREVFDIGDDAGGEDGGDDSERPIDAIDFEKYVVLVIEDGFGSGSITHHWKRVETTDRGVRVHGCHAMPYEQTSDLSSRHSVVRVERPDTFEIAHVSLTVDPDRRVHFNSTEDVVSIDEAGHS